jgi:hypothetical protein
MPTGPRDRRRGEGAVRGFSGPAGRGVRRPAPSRPNAPATGRVPGWGSTPWRDDAAFRAVDCAPRLPEPWMLMSGRGKPASCHRGLE